MRKPKNGSGCWHGRGVRKFQAPVKSAFGQNILEGRTDVEGRHGFLIISGGDVRGRIIGNVKDEKDKVFILREIDGIEHTVLKCRIRYLKYLKKFREAGALMSALTQFLSENDIRTFFYDIWLTAHNENAKRSQRTEFNRYRYEMKRGMLKKDGDSGFIRHITNDMSRAEMAKCCIA